MDKTLIENLSKLTTAHLADGCLRTGVPIRFAPPNLRPIAGNMECRGQARPVRHVGSIDIFLEALDGVTPGDIFVIDNGGRLDEACIGDIVLLEAMATGIAGFVIWGLHRDSKELSEIGFPVFSLGSLPTGPQRVHVRPPDMFSRAVVGQQEVTPSDFVVADANGILFLPADRLYDIVPAAMTYRETEARHLKAMREGKSYRSQTRFSDYLLRREQQPNYSFRQHLKDIEAAGEV